MIPLSAARDYVTDEFYEFYRVYRITEELHCLPFAGGWAEQPEWVTEVLLLFRQEEDSCIREEEERRRRESRYGR